MYSSMEKESFLSKLLESDAKKGLSREIPSPRTQRNLAQSSATYEDAPRHLRGGGGLANQRNAPHRKSLPNLHASSFSFWEGMNKNKNNDDDEKKTSTPTKPKITKAKSSGTLNKEDQKFSRKYPTPKWENLIGPTGGGGVPPDLLPKDIQMPRAKSICIE